MDRGIIIGLGVSVASVAIPYAIKSVPPYVAWAGIAAGIAITLYAALPDASRPPVLSAGLYLLAIVALTSGLGYQHTRPDTPVIKPVDLLNGTVDFRCEQSQIPTVVPPEGGYNAIPLFFNGNDLQLDMARMSFQQAPGTPLTYPEGFMPWGAVLCRLTNYGEKPLYGLKLPVEVTVHKRIQDPNNPHNATARTAGEVLWKGNKELYIDKLDTGPDRVYSFYVQGLNEFVGMVFADRFSARPFSGDNERLIDFVRANTPRDREFMVAPANPEPKEVRKR